MKKGEIKHTIKPKNAPKKDVQTLDEWVGIGKVRHRVNSLIKVTVEMPEALHKKLMGEAVSKSSRENRVYMRDILIEALDQYFEDRI